MRDFALGKASAISTKSGVLFLIWIATLARRKEATAPILLIVPLPQFVLTIDLNIVSFDTVGLRLCESSV